MSGPLDLPSRAVSGALEGLGSMSEAARRLPEFQHELLELLRALEQRMNDQPLAIERTLRPHFDGQRRDIRSLKPELVRNREAVEALLDGIDGVRDELRGLRSEMAEVRAAVEPLQGPAERAARLSDRLPGGE